ncbi:MAG: hypothetical protein KME43_05505 [Myxacorys chilensis ATA2-1-KO14]|nr:hypothetical protein [Myxacorys chilensis ATA2-1-KO14]
MYNASVLWEEDETQLVARPSLQQKAHPWQQRTYNRVRSTSHEKGYLRSPIGI